MKATSIETAYLIEQGGDPTRSDVKLRKIYRKKKGKKELCRIMELKVSDTVTYDDDATEWKVVSAPYFDQDSGCWGVKIRTK